MPTRVTADLPRLVLASGSDRRRELLATVGVSVEVMVSDIDETPLAHETAQDLVARLASGKAEVGARLISNGSGSNGLGPAEGGAFVGNVAVIGADTVVEIDGVVLGKPVDDADAASMLRSLSGKTHRAHTGICVVCLCVDGDDQMGVAVSTTAVSMRDLTDADIAWYLATGEHRGKAGSYAIQGFAAPFVTGIEGPYDGVVGLPLQRLDQLLTQLGWPLRSFSESGSAAR